MVHFGDQHVEGDYILRRRAGFPENMLCSVAVTALKPGFGTTMNPDKGFQDLSR